MTVVDEWDTAQNKGVEADKIAQQSSGGELSEHPEPDWMNLARAAAATGEDMQLWAQFATNHRAFQSRHFEGSKYGTKRYKGRSRLFRPKTRAKVRQTMAAAAQSLFSTADVVQIEAQQPNDPVNAAAALLQHEIINMRMDRSSTAYGIQWFLLAMGARQDAQITGVCVSKQYWEYERRPLKYELAVDPETGEEEEVVVEWETLKDRPRIELFPPEQVLRDPGAPWTDQLQAGSFVILKHVMTLGDLRTMIRMNVDKAGVTQWKPLTDQQLMAGVDKASGSTVRRSREGDGDDRYDNGGNTIDEFRECWLHENFMRIDGDDWVFWTVGTQHMLSDPVLVKEAYPEQKGQRPLVLGFGELEAHKITPQAPVESWQPLQQEANEITNLRLDIIKQNMAPISKVVRGKRVDMAQVQNKSADSVIMVDDKDDVTFERPPDIASSAYAEMDRINVDMDDLSGAFSGGTVQSNRSLNETVGGLNLLNNAAAAVAEFDERVWIETWVEPVLRQLVNLEAYYEDDIEFIGLAGQAAKLWPTVREALVLEGLMTAPVKLQVNVGLGSHDPMKRLEKLGIATRMTLELLGEDVRMSMKKQELVNEIYGAAGFKNSERFFEDFGQADQMVQMAQQKIGELEKQLADKGAELESKAKDREADVLMTRIKAATDLLEEHIRNQRDMQNAQNAQWQQASQRMVESGARQ